MNRVDVDQLADYHGKSKSEAGYWSASQLYFKIATIADGLGPDERCFYFLKALAAVKHVSKRGNPGSLTLQISCQSKVLWYNRSPEEVEGMASAMIEVGQMVDTDVNADDTMALYRGKQWVAILLFGQVNSPYSFTARELGQAKEGALLFTTGTAYRYSPQKIDSLVEGSFEKCSSLDFSLYPLTCYTICLVDTVVAMDFKRSMWQDIGTRAREAVETYVPAHDLVRYDFPFL